MAQAKTCFGGRDTRAEYFIGALRPVSVRRNQQWFSSSIFAFVFLAQVPSLTARLCHAYLHPRRRPQLTETYYSATQLIKTGWVNSTAANIQCAIFPPQLTVCLPQSAKGMPRPIGSAATID